MSARALSRSRIASDSRLTLQYKVYALAKQKASSYKRPSGSAQKPLRINGLRVAGGRANLLGGDRIVLDADGPPRHRREQVAHHRTNPRLGESMARGLARHAPSDQQCNTKPARHLVIDSCEARHDKPPKLLLRRGCIAYG